MLDRPDENGLYPLVRVASMAGNPVEENPLDLLFNRFLERGQVPLRQLKFHVERAEDLRACLEGARLMGFVGFGVTVPYKTAIVDLCDEIVEDSRGIGAINDVIFEGPERRAVGRNTDGVAVMHAIARIGTVAGARVALLGAGGVGRGIAASMASGGAASIAVIARRPEQGDAVAEMISSRRTGTTSTSLRWDGRVAVPDGTDIVVNVTPVGSAPDVDELDVDFTSVAGARIAVDVVTGPRTTPFIRRAHELGLRTIDGVDMLVDIVHVNIGLFGVEVDRDEIDAYARELCGPPIRDDS